MNHSQKSSIQGEKKVKNTKRHTMLLLRQLFCQSNLNKIKISKYFYPQRLPEQ